jgi:FkbM family methyltransferase
MKLRARSLITYVLDRLVNRHPRFRLFLLNMFFADRDVDIELYGSRLRVNMRKDIGYLNAYKRAQLSVVFRHESGVLATLALLLEPTDTFVDIGANIGLFSSVIARVENVFPQTRFYAFEPHPDTVKRLQATLMGRNVQIFDRALSDHGGDLEFCESAESSTFSVKHSQNPFQIKSRTLQIKSVTLDNIPIEGDSIVLKIDVENHEAEVLKGAQRLLNSGRVKAVYLDGYTDKKIPALLRTMGFELFDGHTLVRGESGFSLLAIHSKHLERWAHVRRLSAAG